jgi:deazaflavin-dependent oxidoreductase (nitroreductase family)
MPLREAFADSGFKLMNRVHQAILTASGRRLLTTPFGMPALTLEVTGRKSGRPRTTTLTAPIIDDEKVVLVASKGGDDRDPEWFKNVLVNPDVKVTMIKTGEVRHLRARRASEDERAALWPQIVTAYKGYAGYQRRTERPIPVIICERSE